MNKTLNEKIEKEDLIICKCSGNSMLPFIHENDNVLIHKIKEEIKKYDVILYTRNNINVLHRVINIDQEYLYVRGDNTISVEKIKRENVIGVLVGYYNGEKYFEVNEEINKRNFKTSNKTLIFRKIKYYIRKTIK